MLGHIIYSYALVALASTAYAIPFKVGSNDLVERTPQVDIRGLAGKVGVVDIGKDYVERRLDEAKASNSTASGKATATNAPKPAKATTPADLPGCPAPAANNSKKNGTEPAGPKPKPSGTGASPKASAGAGTGSNGPKKNGTEPASAEPKSSGTATLKAPAGTAPAPKKASDTGTAGKKAKGPLGCDPTKPQAAARALVGSSV